MIYISKSVDDKLDEYAAFLRHSASYTIDEAKIRKWEVEYQINQHCNPILMKPNSSGTIKFKSVLQRQEIERFVNNRSQLIRIIKRRRGGRGNTQWNVDYIVSIGGDVFITAIKCYNTFSESVHHKNIQQIISECVSKCLRKYLNENVNINEARQQANQTDKGFERWKKVFDGYLSEMVNELQTDYLSNLHLTININSDYVFNGGKSRWLAAYERRSRQIESGVVSIGINYPLFYSKMCQMHTDKDRFNIEAQARITIGHEIGHGLVDYIKLLGIKPSMLSEMPNVKIIMYCGERKEERLVEEFGEYQFPEATGCWSSVLCDALEELNSVGNDV